MGSPSKSLTQILAILFLSIIVCGSAQAQDEFEGVKCGGDIPKSLIGKRSSNERVMVLEGRHKDLGLKDLGGMEISDRFFLISWRVCGSEYAVLVNTKKDLVRDVLQVPAHSLHSPQSFVEQCQLAGREIPDTVIAILDNSQGKKPKGYFGTIMLPVKIAWKIDERQEQFVPMPTQGLSCVVSGSSADVKQ